MLSYTGCIGMVSPQYESSYVYQDHSSVNKLFHNGCIEMVSPQYESSYAYQVDASVEMLSYTGCIGTALSHWSH